MSTRYFTLHWFPREDEPGGDPRLGLAVPKAVGNAVLRNRLKRQLRDAWTQAADTARPGRDYVLVARPGLAEPAERRGQGWLVEQLDDVLRRASA